jgi:hypothetical protein
MSTSSASGRREAAVARRAGVEIASENKISQPREPIDDVLRVDEKNIREYSVRNVSGVIITTNHKTNGIFLPADDRRHYVAWSDLSRPSFEREYWNKLWCWYNAGGDGHVAAYLAQLDLSSFDAKAPPPKTQAFWEIVGASRAPEDDEMQDAIDVLGNPDALIKIAPTPRQHIPARPHPLGARPTMVPAGRMLRAGCGISAGGMMLMPDTTTRMPPR